MNRDQKVLDVGSMRVYCSSRGKEGTGEELRNSSSSCADRWGINNSKTIHRMSTLIVPEIPPK